MKTKRLLSAMLTLALMLTLLPGAFTIPAGAGIELGTSRVISTKEELVRIGRTGTYRLTADIDLAGEDWTPLPEFSGELNGNGHVIRNLAITDTTGGNKGLFASIAIGSMVYDLGIEGANITAGDNVGIIAGTNAGRISRCYTTGTVSGGSNVGGLVGTNSGTIRNCYSRASVSGTEYLGGLAGSNSGTVSTSYAASTVKDSVLKNYLKFNGTGYIDIPNNNAYTGTAFTLEAWFQRDSTGLEFIISKSGTAVEDTEWFEIHTLGDGLRFIPIPNGNISLDSKAVTRDSWIDVKNVLQPGWFHVAAVYWYDSAKQEALAQVYVNGEAQELYQATNPTSVGKTAKIARTTNPLADVKNNADISIGRRGDNSLYFNGKIADVRFWSTARTAEEIKTNKDKVLTGSEAGLVGYWQLNEASGTVVHDISSTDNDGTVVGTVERTTTTETAANKGALVGTGTVTHCFYDSTVYGSTSGGEGTGKTTVEMKTQSTYTETDWKDTSIWKIADGSYPCFYKYATPTAAFTATGESTGTLSGVTNGMKYKVGGGSWTDITSSDNINLTALSACTIQVVKKGNGTTTIDSDAQSIIVTKSATPTITAAQPTAVGGKGSIPMTLAHEYKSGAATIWTSATGSIELAPGAYDVRVKATGTVLASASQTLTIIAYTPPSDGGGVPILPPTPKAPVIVDGKELNIGTVKTEDKITTVTVDQNALKKQLDDAKENVVIPVDRGQNADTAKAQLVVANVNEMAEKEMTLSVQVDEVSYDMPAASVNTAALMEELGATDPDEVPIDVTITELTDADVTLENGELVLPPVQFTVTASYGGRSVEVETFQRYVQRVIEIPAGADAGKITTAVVVENGKQRHVPTEVFQKDGKWYARVNSLTNSTYALIWNEADFTDDDGKWFESIVTEMASRGIINGKGEGVFDGEASITRAEFAAILVRALGLPENGDGSVFTDVSKTAWYHGAVGKAYEYGLIEGRSAGLFAPGASITRQEAMAMVHRAAAIAEYAGTTGTLEPFRDAGSVSSWALEDAKWNVGSGLISGNDKGEICGQNYITRGETATIVLRLLQKSGLVDVRAQA